MATLQHFSQREGKKYILKKKDKQRIKQKKKTWKKARFSILDRGDQWGRETKTDLKEKKKRII